MIYLPLAAYQLVTWNETHKITSGMLLNGILLNIDGPKKALSVGFRPVAELSIVVAARGPHAAVLLEHRAVSPACSHALHPARDYLNKTLSVGVRSISEMTIGIFTRGPHTTILLQHQAVPKASSRGVDSASNDLDETASLGF